MAVRRSGPLAGKLEAEFLPRDDYSEIEELETRRRIAEAILSAAFDKEPPFEACEKAWSDLLRLGFSNDERRFTMTLLYANCCVFADKPEEGLAVVEPLLAELQRRLEEARATQAPTGFYEHRIPIYRERREELKALQRRAGPPT